MDGLQGNWTIDRDPAAVYLTMGSIATRAYYLWLEDGCRFGDCLRYWSKAETEHLINQNSTH